MLNWKTFFCVASVFNCFLVYFSKMFFNKLVYVCWCVDQNKNTADHGALL